MGLGLTFPLDHLIRILCYYALVLETDSDIEVKLNFRVSPFTVRIYIDMNCNYVNFLLS